MRGRKRAATKQPGSSSRQGGLGLQLTANPCKFFQLPRLTVFDILSRLPVDTLFHCRCVCKRLRRFISDPEFASLHLSRSPVCILIKTLPLQNASKRLTIAHVGPHFQVMKMNFTPKSNIPTLDITHMNSCNGLLCLIGPEKDYSFYVCNPILGEFIKIQPSYKGRHRGSFWGLGYATVSNKFKILQTYYPVVESGKRCVLAEIYTIGSGSWRSIGNAPADTVALPYNAYLNGALHWFPCTPNGSEFIHTFDFETEQFGSLAPPDHFREEDKKFTNYSRVGVLEGCLYIIYFTNSRQFDIWIMKEYGVKESWTKQFVIENLYPKQGSWDFYEPMSVLNNGEILLWYNNDKVVCYNPKRKNVRTTQFFRTRSQFDAIAYTPSFVSLYNVAKGEQISRMLGTRDVDKVQTEEYYQDCAGCGAQVINTGSNFPPFGAPYGAVNYHAEIYARNSAVLCTACQNYQVAHQKTLLTLWPTDSVGLWR
ncbi:hypothetical protein COLO4_13971 [Corchorus olitorius]|uniref:F-box domain-containing protein n=1 Tax=Corchorus olitorius TaxID=93759 RepID=A0A1R3JU37_9ROSI|nr:hypothetical protein COLO4_13971 [Corchorus olitorius]